MRSLIVAAVVLSILQIQTTPTLRAQNSSMASSLQPGLSSITFSSVGPIASIEMNGTVNWTYGSDQQTGTVVLQAAATGKSRIEFQTDRGSRVETQNSFGDATRHCTWNGSDGVAHNSATHQCWLDTVWFLPQITIQAGAGAADDVAPAPVSVDPQTVRFHHERHPTDAGDLQAAELLAHLSALDLFVDAATGLPRTLQFSGHPDDDAGIDISVEIRYSDYRVMNGVSVPFHIQKFINQSLVLDLQLSTVQVQLGPAAAGTISSSLQ
jgi:hypothetical protein